MKEKKNIDRLYQEKFKDFESDPNERVWGNIAASLDKKEKKRPLIIPLWFKIGSVAAVLAVIIAGLVFTNTQNKISNEPSVVLEEKDAEDDSQENSNNANTVSKTVEADSIKSNSRNKASEDEFENTQITDQNSSNSEIQQERLKNKREKISSIKTDSSSRVTEISTVNKEKPKKLNEALIPGVSRDASGLTANMKTEEYQDSISDNLNKSLLEKEEALVQLQQKELTETAKDKETEEGKSRKFRVGTFAAPVYYTNLGSGNEISAQFNSNPSSSQVNLAYGVNVAYSISKKLKIRTGISKLSMSYSIQEVGFSPTAIAENIENIDPNEDNVIIRNNAPSDAFELPTDPGSENSLTSAIFTPGEINQQFGFIEVPFEIEYSLIDSKFGLNLIGGVSSLFLDENSIDLISGNTTTNLGKASNINRTSFSTNVGLGIHYKLTDKFSLNLEPIFKYQLNTFNNVENVTPINIGVYSGLSIKF